MITEYIVVKGLDSRELSDRVNVLIKEGYVPIGGVATAPVKWIYGEVHGINEVMKVVFSQAMIKEG